MNKTRRMIRASVLAVAVSAATLVAAAPAEAAGPCPSGYFCISEADTFSDGYHWAKFRYGADNLSQFLGGSLNDNVRSFINRTNKHWCLYEHAYYEGDVVGVLPNDSGDYFRPTWVSSLKAC